MKSKLLLIMTCAAVVCGSFGGMADAKERIVFGGGPAGGTFQVVANSIQVYKPIKASPNFKVQAQSSAGSWRICVRPTPDGRI